MIVTRRNVPASARRQRGAVAIIVGLSLAVLIGAAGLALDTGRLYVTKTELQNASDACALGASFELTGFPSIPAGNFAIAEAAGRTVAARNRVGFQATSIDQNSVTVEFGTALTGGTWLTAGSTPSPTAKYVRCTIPETNILSWFMQVRGAPPSTVRSAATASLVPSQQSCNGLPIGLCAPSTTSPYGLVPGKWYNGGLSNSGQLTGNFNWVDYSPPNGGVSELKAILEGPGVCLTNVGTQVGQSGAAQSLRTSWNTRFGIYTNDYNAAEQLAIKPDRSGYGYTALNWDAVAGNALADFIATRRPANTPYGIPNVANGNTITGLDVKPPNSTVLQPAALALRGASRRIATAPILDCTVLAASTTAPILDYGCVLMLHPMDNNPALTIYMEYIGLANAAGGPCAGSGIPGGPLSTGPKVPGLVQ